MNWEAIAGFVATFISLIIMLIVFGSKLWQMVKTMESNIKSNAENFKDMIKDIREEIDDGRKASILNNSIAEKNTVKINNLERMLPDLRKISTMNDLLLRIDKNTRETNGKVMRHEAVIESNCENIKEIYNKLNNIGDKL